MITYFVASANDPRPSGDEAECAVSVVCRASSRMAALQRIRGAGISGVRTRDLSDLKGVNWDVGTLPLPGADDVWVRPAYAEGEWERLA